MNTRILIVLALVIAVIAGWFFQQQGKISPPIKLETSEVDYEATDIKAGSAAINQQTGEMRLSGGFMLASEEKAAATDIEPIKISGQTLMGNTKSRQVYSNEPVKVEQGMNRFQASSMKANLETGEYEFGQIAVSFLPAQRKDKALF